MRSSGARRRDPRLAWFLWFGIVSALRLSKKRQWFPKKCNCVLVNNEVKSFRLVADWVYPHPPKSSMSCVLAVIFHRWGQHVFALGPDLCSAAAGADGGRKSLPEHLRQSAHAICGGSPIAEAIAIYEHTP
jgi:hypothetical protein